MKSEAIKVLLVDYSVYTANELKKVLDKAETASTLKTTTTIDKALPLIDSYHPDVVVVELGLPEKSGIELVKYIKGHHISSKVVVLTHFTAKGFRDECKKQGADYFLDKGEEIAKIATIIKATAA